MTVTNILYYSILFIFLFPKTPTRACTNILITKGASKDGSTIISYAADSHNLFGELYHFPSQTYNDGALMDVYEWDTGKSLGQIPQVPQTYSVVGNMNEYQVTISETTFGGRTELQDTTGLIDYGSLMFIALQRSKTAREAIQTMTDLVQSHGYYSTGESFSIADANEVWIMEMIGKGLGNKGAVWVAVKIPDGMVSAHANQARITNFALNDPDNCIYDEGVIEFAKSKGYFSGKDKDFSFADAFAPLDFGALRFCEARVWSAFCIMDSTMVKFEATAKGESLERLPLFIKPLEKVSVRDVMGIMRNHYEGTALDMTKDPGAGPFKSPYRFRPLTWKVGDTTYFNERAIATQQTGFSFVAQMRNWLINPIGGVLWFGVDDANTTVYVPMYCGINNIPSSYAVGNGDLLTFTWEAAFWVFNFVSNQAYARYSLMIKDIRSVQTELEDSFANSQLATEQKAELLYQQSPMLAQRYLTEYSNAQAQLTVDRWRHLGQFLLVKYLDGNLHEEKNGVFLKNPYGKPANAKHPEYDQSFYEQIVKATGDKFKVKEIGAKGGH